MPRSDTKPDFLTATVVQIGLPPVWTNSVAQKADKPGPGTSPACMVEHWYIEADGRVEGPLSADELRERAAAGRLLPTDSVSPDGVQWNTASSVPGLTFPRPTLLETVVSGSVHQQSAPAAPGAVPVVAVRGYQILDPLGIGACGVVHKAFHEGLKRVVALKTLLVPGQASEDTIERFKQEAVALARLQHPNIVAVYDYGECEKPPGQAYIAMELLDG